MDAGQGEDELGAGEAGAASGQANEQQNSLGEKARNLGRTSKRSLTNLRKRDRSTASKRSAQPPQDATEKERAPPSSGQTASTGQSQPKKKSGFLSFLNCCSAPDEGQELGQAQAAQPAKPSKTQPTRVQQPAPSRQQPNASTTGTSTDDSKEVVNEKGQPPYQDVLTAEPILPVPDGEKPPLGDATVDKPISNGDAPPTQPNYEVRPLEADGQQMTAADPAPGPPLLDTASAARDGPSSSQSPQVQVQAPTPVVAQQSEDEMILDRTPEQAARDNDIEMSDAGPSLPLSEQDAAVVVEEEKQAHERRESASINREDLPPPPPLQNRQEQPITQDGTPVSQETSMVSTPEQGGKWLLPPLRPELRGRKCLVLDLDETLVHSSFKVSKNRKMFNLVPRADNCIRYYIKRTSQYQSRSKDSTTTSMS